MSIAALPVTGDSPVVPGLEDADTAWSVGHVDRLVTSASVVTLIRTVLCVALCGTAVLTGATGLLLVALVVHWAGDTADGAIARRRGEETVTGAVLDISADRLCVCAVYLVFVVSSPQFTVPVLVYLFEFAFVDTVLSLAFLRFGLLSPNYFDRVDARVWRWNWWLPAKALNSALVAVLCVVFQLVWVGLAVATALLVVKSVCLLRVSRRLSRRSGSEAAVAAGSAGGACCSSCGGRTVS